MASTYSDRLKLELMETGANANTWGNNTNTNLQTLDAFTAGYLSKDVAGSANVTLTSNNADPTAESSNKVIEFTGTLTGNIYVFIPAVENNYIFFNNTSGAFTVTIAPDGHAANGVAITQGAHTIMYNTASNEIKDLFSGSLGNLSLVSGGVFTGNASGASALNASNVASGTIDDARLTANVTLNNASTISAGTLADARLTANVTLNNASTISTGTLNNDRLDTVPTTKGGTGLTSLGSAGQVLTVNAPGAALEFADAAAGGLGANCVVTCFTAPGTFTPHADTQMAIVSVTGGGGGGGAASVPGASPGTGCTGCPSCFGTLLVATGGAGGVCNGKGATQCVPQQGGCGDLNIANAWAVKGLGAAGPDYVAGYAAGDDISVGCGNGGNGGRGGNQSPQSCGKGGGGGGVAVGILTADQYAGGTTAIVVGAGGNRGPGNHQAGNEPQVGKCGRVKIVEIIP